METHALLLGIEDRKHNKSTINNLARKTRDLQNLKQRTSTANRKTIMAYKNPSVLMTFRPTVCVSEWLVI